MESKIKPLWSDGKSFYDIDCWHDLDAHKTIYNLYEDIQCLKEELTQIKKDKKK